MTHSSLQKEADSRDNVVIQTGQSTYVPETPSKRRYCETEEQVCVSNIVDYLDGTA